MSKIDDILDSNDGKLVIIKNLLYYLNEEISTFDYNGDYSYLVDIFSYIGNLLSEIKSKVSLNDVHDIFKDTHDRLQVLLVQKPGNIKKDNPNFLLLKSLINNLEALDLSYLSDYIEHYRGNSYQFISYLMFDVRNFSFVETAVEKYPHIVNFVDENGISIIDRVVEKYISSVEDYTAYYRLNDNSEVLYYDSLLKLLISSEKLDYNFLERKQQINLLESIKLNINNDKFNDLTKRKFVYWINRLQSLIEGTIDNIDYEEFKYRYDIKEKFDFGVVSSVKKISDTFKRDISQSNMRRMYTIDGEYACEIDDGLSVEMLENGNFSLGVHIANPYSVVGKSNIIMDEAYKRGTSIYLSDRVISMFHEDVSKNLISLNENYCVPVLSYYYEVDHIGNIINFEIVSENMKTYKKLSYNETNDILNNNFDKKIYSEVIVEDLNLLRFVTNVLNKGFSFNDEYIELNRNDSNASQTNITLKSRATKIVETSMVLTNNYVAKYMSDHHYPFIYRCHCIDPNFVSKLNYYKSNLETDEFKKYLKMIKEIYPSAFYSTYNRGHYGLNLDFYSHITSPLRRFADIACDEALMMFYNHNPSDKQVYEFEEYLKSVTTHINAKCRKANSFTGEYEKIYSKLLK